MNRAWDNAASSPDQSETSGDELHVEQLWHVIDGTLEDGMAVPEVATTFARLRIWVLPVCG